MCKDKGYNTSFGHRGKNADGETINYPTQDEYWEMLEEAEKQKEDNANQGA